MLGVLFCVIALAIVVFLRDPGDPLPASGPDLDQPQGRRHPEGQRRLPRPAARDADRRGALDRARRRRSASASRCGWCEYGRPRALARLVESTVEMLAGDAVDRACAVRPAHLPVAGRSASCRRRQRGRLRKVVLRRGHDALAGRAAASRRDVREGLQAIPQPRARGLLRARQDARSRRSAGCCCRPCGRQCITGSMLGIGHIDRRHRDHPAAARRHARCCRASATCRCSGSCAEPARRSPATSTTTRRRASSTSPTRPTRRRSCCC